MGSEQWAADLPEKMIGKNPANLGVADQPIMAFQELCQNLPGTLYLTAPGLPTVPLFYTESCLDDLVHSEGRWLMPVMGNMIEATNDVVNDTMSYESAYIKIFYCNEDMPDQPAWQSYRFEDDGTFARYGLVPIIDFKAGRGFKLSLTNQLQ
jgi:hypothetical protein